MPPALAKVATADKVTWLVRQMRALRVENKLLRQELERGRLGGIVT